MAASLARAFADDPVSNWMLPRARRHTRMIAMFSLMLRSQVSFAETYSTPDGVGAAVWAPPGRWRLDLEAIAASVQGYASIFGPNLARAIEVHTTLEDNHPTDPPHWYLAGLGTHPDWQGTVSVRLSCSPFSLEATSRVCPLSSSARRNATLPITGEWASK